MRKLKDKCKKYDFANLPAGISKESAQHFIDHRKILKKPLTQHALDLSMDHAANASQIGLTPAQAINKTIEKGWLSINLGWLNKEFIYDTCETKQCTLKRFTDKSWAK